MLPTPTEKSFDPGSVRLPVPSAMTGLRDAAEQGGAGAFAGLLETVRAQFAGVATAASRPPAPLRSEAASQPSGDPPGAITPLPVLNALPPALPPGNLLPPPGETLPPALPAAEAPELQSVGPHKAERFPDERRDTAPDPGIAAIAIDAEPGDPVGRQVAVLVLSPSPLPVSDPIPTRSATLAPSVVPPPTEIIDTAMVAIPIIAAGALPEPSSRPLPDGAQPPEALQMAASPSSMRPNLDARASGELAVPHAALANSAGRKTGKTTPDGASAALPGIPTPSPALAPPTSAAAPVPVLASSPAMVSETGAAQAVTPAAVSNTIEASIEHLAGLRDAARSARPELTVRHGEFGAVSLRIEANPANPGEWRALLASRDPGFVPAVQAALALRAVAAAGDATASGGFQSGANTSGNGTGAGSGHPNYGSFPGSQQGSSQPYSAQGQGERRNAAKAINDDPSAAAGAPAGPVGGLFA
jgi:hypothetical protein